LKFKFKFASTKLDDKNWVVDFGGLKELKEWLQDNFDHKVIVDSNDPEIDTLYKLEQKGLAEIRVFDGVGAEKFAYHAWKFADNLVRDMSMNRCWCIEAECAEHGANSAIYSPY
jgi:6-pyruvoyltetrahydropterin/6-carboxytetrahydropterin synthase